MRKSIDGLCAIIEDQLKMDPTSSGLPVLWRRTGSKLCSVNRMVCPDHKRLKSTQSRVKKYLDPGKNPAQKNGRFP